MSEAAVDRANWSRAGTLLGLLALTHLLVDTVATTINPLWPALQREFQLGPTGGLCLYVLWSSTTSFGQFLFGYLGDRWVGRLPLWLGPAVAIVCLGGIGLVPAAWFTALMLLLGGLGVAAFHPEAAAAASRHGRQMPSRAMSIFAMGGYLGQSLGPLYSGAAVTAGGLLSLTWGIAPGLLILWGVTAWATRLGSHPSSDSLGSDSLGGQGADGGLAHRELAVEGKAVREQRARGALRRQWRLVLLVLAVGTLRVVGAAGCTLSLAYLVDARGGTSQLAGSLQSAFMVGIGAGSLLSAVWGTRRLEPWILLLAPIAVTPLLAGVPWAGGRGQFLDVAACGLLIGMALPVLISVCQQLFPGSQRVASSLAMGVSWGSGSAVVAVLLRVLDGRFETLFAVFAAASLLSSCLSLLLPIWQVRPANSSS